jgi:hypothetical protein
MPDKWLSKSKYLNGLQCPKLLWIAVNEPERMPEPDAATQQIFDQGHEVGNFAKKLFPRGIDVPEDNFMDNIKITRELLEQRRPLFEAGILSNRIYARVDILNPVHSDEWDIIEVKSTTSVKDVNIDDVSFQKLVCEESGIKINRCFLAFLNNQYVRQGDLNPQELFSISDITDDVLAREKGLRGRVKAQFEIIDSPLCPEVNVGPHCNKPYDCLFDECWNGLPEHNVFTLYYGGSKSHELYRNGVLDICEIIPGYKLSDKQQIQFDCATGNDVHLDKAMVSKFLSSLDCPLYYLDFETINPAVPLFDNSKPYQQIPFQYSLHVQTRPGAQPEHYWFLAEGQDDPRLAVLKSLHKIIGPEGSVMSYNKSFEVRTLKQMAEIFSEYERWVDDINSRMVDLMEPFRSFSYYNPLQKGSVSLKQVLTAVTGRSYERMDIAEGGEASRRFLHITFGNASPEEISRTRESLLKYCGQDTEGMVWIVDELRRLVTT